VAQKIADLVLAGSEGEITAAPAEAVELIDGLRITTKENISFARGIKLTGSKVGGYVHFDRKTSSIVVGEGDLSDELLSGISMHITASVPTPMGVDQDSLPADKVEAARQAAIQEAKDSGKPQEIAEKIATGKLRKWVDDNSLMGQIYLREMDAKQPIREFMPKGSSISAFVRYQVGETGAAAE
jgi:elongation factor Ts